MKWKYIFMLGNFCKSLCLVNVLEISISVKGEKISIIEIRVGDLCARIKGLEIFMIHIYFGDLQAMFRSYLC